MSERTAFVIFVVTKSTVYIIDMDSGRYPEDNAKKAYKNFRNDERSVKDFCANFKKKIELIEKTMIEDANRINKLKNRDVKGISC